MSWTTITEADVLTVLSKGELDGIRAAATAYGQSDPLPAQISVAVGEVRFACGQFYVLGEGETVPAMLKWVVLDLIASRLPQPFNRSPSKGRADKEKVALKTLEQIAAGKMRLPLPTIAAADQHTAYSRPSVSNTARDTNRANQDGI